jgi:hypothetical protein
VYLGNRTHSSPHRWQKLKAREEAQADSCSTTR